ncbi:hypothetical protein GGF32_001047 [Allomyces javanicus]|nr:hypothetical protein GGF32_001047 [Allomyces javanicus]
MNPFDHDPLPALGATSTPRHDTSAFTDRANLSARPDPHAITTAASPASSLAPFYKPLARRLNWSLDDDDDHDDDGRDSATHNTASGFRGRGWSDDEDEDEDDEDDVDDYGAPKGWWDRTATASSSHPSHTADDGWFAHRDSSPEDTIRIPTVEELLITEEDLERAKRKLPEDEHLDAEQSIERMLGRLESHRLNPSPPTAAASRSSSSAAPPAGDADALTDETVAVAASVTLAFNHIPIVTHLTVSTATHAVHGPCLALRDGGPVLSSFADHVAYYIPGTRITDVRRKFPETEDPWVAFTVNDDKFLQLVPTADHAAAVDAIARAIKGIVAADAGDRVETAAARVEVPMPALAEVPMPAPMVAPQARPSAGADPVTLAQAMAAEIADATAAFQATLDEIRARYAALMAGAQCAAEIAVVPPAPLPDDDVVMEEAVPADCTVCYAQVVELVIDPCDHRICRKCWNRLAEPKCCPWDRAPGVSVRALSSTPEP